VDSFYSRAHGSGEFVAFEDADGNSEFDSLVTSHFRNDSTSIPQRRRSGMNPYFEKSFRRGR
jgi:hypothetical protein